MNKKNLRCGICKVRGKPMSQTTKPIRMCQDCESEHHVRLMFQMEQDNIKK